MQVNNFINNNGTGFINEINVLKNEIYLLKKENKEIKQQLL